jgi:hypothetical protein
MQIYIYKYTRSYKYLFSGVELTFPTFLAGLSAVQDRLCMSNFSDKKLRLQYAHVDRET